MSEITLMFYKKKQHMCVSLLFIYVSLKRSDSKSRLVLKRHITIRNVPNCHHKPDDQPEKFICNQNVFSVLCLLVGWINFTYVCMSMVYYMQLQRKYSYHVSMKQSAGLNHHTFTNIFLLTQFSANLSETLNTSTNSTAQFAKC